MTATDTFEVFYDGDCPICRREIAWVRRFAPEGAIRFTDIADDEFDPEDLDRSTADLMARMHGRTPDGEWIEGVEVFRRLYTRLGLAPLVALTRLPGLSHLLEYGYRWFARNRLQWTGRCTDDVCTTHAQLDSPPDPS